MTNAIPLSFVVKIGEILIKFGGANSRIIQPNSDFIHYLTNETRFGHEYRFQGKLGFGGKFRTCNNRWKVDCYSEDSTTEKEVLINKINEELKNLYSEYLESLKNEI